MRSTTSVIYKKDATSGMSVRVGSMSVMRDHVAGAAGMAVVTGRGG